jgi:hypothetical protein
MLPVEKGIADIQYSFTNLYGLFILGLSEKSNRNYYLVSQTAGNANWCKLTKIVRRPVFTYWISTA